jgi:hypothetical protein
LTPTLKLKENLLQNFAKTSTRRHTAKAKVIYKVPKVLKVIITSKALFPFVVDEGIK